VPTTAKKTTQVAVYEVKVGGETVLSTSSPTAAREEAKRLGGSLKVTSRPLEAADPVSV
jgi:hypothetical protein